MKLFLTSNGLSSRELKREFSKIIEKPAGEVKILVIGTLSERGHKQFIQWVTEELEDINIDKRNIYTANISEEVNFSKFKDADIIYLLGGDTFYILDRLRKNNFKDFLTRYNHKDKIFIAISAGTIIAGPNIKIAEWGSEGDDDHIDLKDLTGLGLTDIATYVHYEDRLKHEIDDFKKIVDYPVETLKDGEALVIINGKKRKIK